MDAIQWEEVLWTVVALVGLGFSIYNLREASLDLTAATASKQNGTRLMWARFSRQLHLTFTVIELAFITIGVVAMFREPSSQATGASRYLFVILLVGASVLLTVITIRWSQVHAAITTALVRRGTISDRRKT